MRLSSHSQRHRERRPGPAGVALLALLLALPGACRTRPTAPPPPLEAERLVYVLQYIAIDYGTAVKDGEIASPFEYREMQQLSRLLVDRADALEALGASEATLGGIRELQERIRTLQPWPEVRALASELAGRLASELGLILLPAAPPDVARGRRFYGRICASCHGEDGRGDGPAAAAMEPPPTAFDAPRMDLIPPQQLYRAIRFGIEGTAMPSYEERLVPERIWDIVFFLMTLRSDFAPREPAQALPLSLADLARHSNEELLALARESGAEVVPAHIDHYRRSPGAAEHTPTPPAPVAETAPSGRAAQGASAPATDGLRVALQLQDAFVGVAEQVRPSVVGVTGYVRDAAKPPAAPAGGRGWREGAPEERLYPGFRSARSGSGFLVSEDGYVLTARHLLVDSAGQAVDLIDVELHGGRHRVARVVGSEATIDLGVLQLEAFGTKAVRGLRPARIVEGRAARVGHWAIALGNPAGPGATFAVGTLASLAERQCYQGELSATLLQASVAAPAGAYGGPLVDIEGSVLGMLVPGPEAGSAPTGTHAFALPIDLALAIYEPLKVKESRRSPWLGFSVLELPSRRQGRERSRPRGAKLPRAGVSIDDVFEPSPAAAADVRVGDVLVSIDGHRLFSVADFQKWLYLSGIGRSVALEIFRDGQTLEKRVAIEERPASAVPR